MKNYRANVRENLLLALDTLRTHKFRSFLTMLGVMMGVATVVLVSAFFVGLETQISTMATQFGTNTLYIWKWKPGITFTVTREMRLRKPLTYAQAMAIQNDCPSIETVAVEAIKWDGPPPAMKYKAREMLDGNLTGATPSDFSIMNTEVAEGRFYTEIDNWHRRNVAVLGADVVTRLFSHEDPLGKMITVGGSSFEVIGTMSKRKEFFIDTGDNRIVFIPYETYLKIYPANKENFILAKAYAGRRQQAIDEVTGLLRRLRRDKPWQPDSFGIGTADSFIQQFNSIIGSTALAMIAVASIGLLVGGIGVMNIMLVSVTERTREIGVRKAIGARRSDISWQFLLEAMTLTGTGGVVGILLSFALVLVIGLLFPKWPLSVPVWAVAAGFIVSVSVGLFFGLWPAVKASRLDPIVALRYE